MSTALTPSGCGENIVFIGTPLKLSHTIKRESLLSSAVTIHRLSELIQLHDI